MAPIVHNPGKSWNEYNSTLKKQRKERREKQLVKKIKKDELDQADIKDETILNKKQISTLSIAIPGSILDNAQSPELRTYLAGQIARAACIYKADEIIVFDDQGEINESEKNKLKKDEVLGEGRVGCIQLARILQYLECPQYLRKYFFPIHKDLQYAGLLNPLDAPHHLRQQDVSLFREGVVTNKPIKNGKGSQVNVGLLNDVHIDKTLTPGLRVTVKIPQDQTNSKRLKGFVVSPSSPRTESGVYWGYNVRLASNLTQVFSKCPYEKSYDLTIGTSDKGTSIDEVTPKSLNYQHALIVFGGLAGLEIALENDPQLNIDDPSLLFDKYLNTCPEQGSRTIRTEEAVLVSLSELRTKLSAINPASSKPQFNCFNESMNNFNNPQKKSESEKEFYDSNDDE